MAKHLDGDRQRLEQDGTGRIGFRVWIVIGIALAAIALAVWRHAGRSIDTLRVRRRAAVRLGQ